MLWIVLFIVALALLLVMRGVLFPADSSTAAKRMATYRHMTPALLGETPDDELVTAVVSNLLAKAQDERRDPYTVIPLLSRERCAVYSVWLFMKELEAGDPSHLRSQGQFGFSELAADALDLLDCGNAATHLRDYLQTADEADVAALRAFLRETDVNALLVELIRKCPDEFCDDENEG
ncbi:MAG: hypothetical protein IJC52_05710 [Clostridia bacterium]|nr:hypothetical protein [Clostridia bacterium]